MQINGVELSWLGHAGFLIRNSRIIYIDPFKIKDGLDKADIILITHSHYDHCSVADINKLVKKGTQIIMPADCQSKINRFDVPIEMKIIEPGQEISLHDLKISAIPAYNIDKHFHPKEESWVGFVVKMGDVVIYHAGDTDLIEEMQKLTGHSSSRKRFIVLLPVGGRFTMTAEEAVEAAKLIKPDLAIPMHYGTIIGSEKDAQDFVQLCKDEKIPAKILEKL